MNGMITEIQRFSLADGPGIRSTVFFKGCNMKCAWCHNPESIAAAPRMMYYPENCISCGMCVKACPSGLHTVGADGLSYDRTGCMHCGRCADVCFAGALALSGTEMTADEVVAEIAPDIPYYRASGGGVTLSGGEVLCQPVFARELLGLCKEQGIHTAIETSLHASWEELEPLLAVTDLVMADLKHPDDAVHQRYTGVSNDRILANLKQLGESGTPLIVRTPVIPAVNGSEGEIAAMAAFLAGLKSLRYYELLGYNPLGETKYRALGIHYALEGVKPLNEDTMEALADCARAYGVEVRCKLL